MRSPGLGPVRAGRGNGGACRSAMSSTSPRNGSAGKGPEESAGRNRPLRRQASNADFLARAPEIVRGGEARGSRRPGRSPGRGAQPPGVMHGVLAEKKAAGGRAFTMVHGDRSPSFSCALFSCYFGVSAFVRDE